MCNDVFICERQRVLNLPLEFLQLNRNTRPEDLTRTELKGLKAHIRLQSLNRYPDCDQYLDALSSFYKVSAELISITSGIDGGIRAVIETFTKPGDKVSYLTPCYAMYRVYSNAYRLDPIEISCDEELKYSVADLFESIRAGAKIVFLTNPHSPVDYSLSEEEFLELLRLAEANGALIFVDEAYHYFGAPSFIEKLRLGVDNLLVARTFSKAFGLPGIRLGTLFSQPRITKAISSRRLSYETNSLSMAVAMGAMANFQYVAEYVKSVAQGRAYIKRQLSSIGLSAINDNLNSVVVKMRDQFEAKQLIDGMYRKKIAIRTLPGEFDEHLLIGLGKPATMKRFWTEFRSIYSGLIAESE